jgi:hypothetical protein
MPSNISNTRTASRALPSNVASAPAKKSWSDWWSDLWSD